MSVYVPNSRHLREVLIFCFNMKKSAAEAHRMLSNTYGEAAISEICYEWFRRFKNGDFDVEDRHSGGRAKMEALLTSLKVMGMIQKQGNWVPYELKPRDVERRLFACEQLLERQRRKEFLHRIVTGNEKYPPYSPDVAPSDYHLF
ncbi:MOS1T transposase, partial [Pseudoatta argentina]